MMQKKIITNKNGSLLLLLLLYFNLKYNLNMPKSDLDQLENNLKNTLNEYYLIIWVHFLNN